LPCASSTPPDAAVKTGASFPSVAIRSRNAFPGTAYRHQNILPGENALRKLHGVSGTTFIGGLNVRAKFGRVNASLPLAQLVLGEYTLVLRLRGPMRHVLIRRALYRDLECVQLVRGFLTRGVKLRLADHRTWYFWTHRAAVVLAELEARGVVVKEGSSKPFLVSDLFSEHPEA
jgi:hypothetical protein